MVDNQGDLFEPWGQLETIDEEDALGFFEDDSRADDPTAPPDEPPPPLRPYQAQGIWALHEAEAEPVQRPLMVMATGSGKTVTIAEHVRYVPHRERILFLAHRDELITQAARTLRWRNPGRRIGIEQAQNSASQSDDIVVASIQTLIRSGLRRLKKFKPFDMVVVDEVHHAVARSYRKILSYCLEANKDVLITGWTATVRRGDNVPLARVMDKVVFERSIFDLWSDAEGGPYLCPLTGKRITTDVDISNVHVRAGEFAKDEIAKAVNVDSRNSKIISAIEDHALGIGKKAIVVYAADVAHAEALAEQCNDRGLSANVVLGKTPKLERFKILRDFDDGKFPVLVNCGVLTEGWDCRRVDCIVPARPILSPLLWEQIQGRGLRPFPGKTDCLLLDIVDNCGKHRRMSLGAAFGIRDIDFLGQDVNKLVTRVKTAAQLMGVQVQDGDTADDINRKLDTIKGLARGTIYVKTQAQLVDVFNATAAAPEVQSDSNFPWIKSGEAEYCLPFNFKDTGQSCVVVLYKDGLGLWHAMNSYNGRVKAQKTPTKTIPFKWADQFVRGQFDYPMWKAKLRTAKWKSKPATEKQKGALQELGISTATLPSNFTGGDASDLIESIKWLRTWKTRRSEVMQTPG